MKAPAAARCPGCGITTLSLNDNDACAACAAERAREAGRQARREVEEHDRARLGLQPTAKARVFTFQALAAADYWLGWWLKFAAPDALDDIARARRLVARAREELGL